MIRSLHVTLLPIQLAAGQTTLDLKRSWRLRDVVANKITAVKSLACYAYMLGALLTRRKTASSP